MQFCVKDLHDCGTQGFISTFVFIITPSVWSPLFLMSFLQISLLQCLLLSLKKDTGNCFYYYVGGGIIAPAIPEGHR